MTGNMVDKITERFDLVAANLTAKTIIILLENIQKVLVQDGILICSGIIESDKNKVLEKMRYAGLNVIETLADGDWISMACRSM
jgi:ribosomal protein L11 methyltransferase